MSCSYRCHCGNDLPDDLCTGRGYCYDCDAPAPLLYEQPAQPPPKAPGEFPPSIPFNEHLADKLANREFALAYLAEQDKLRMEDVAEYTARLSELEGKLAEREAVLRKSWAAFHSIEHCGAPCQCEPEVAWMCGYCFARQQAATESKRIQELLKE